MYRIFFIGLVVAAVFLLQVPSAGAQDSIPLEGKCLKVCTDAGAGDLDGCVKYCTEYVTEPGGEGASLESSSEPGGFGCFFKMVYYCGQSKTGIAILETMITCIKDDFRTSCLTDRMCKFSEDCLVTACECAGYSKSECKGAIDKKCK